jgi:hypothetical protein
LREHANAPPAPSPSHVLSVRDDIGKTIVGDASARARSPIPNEWEKAGAALSELNDQVHRGVSYVDDGTSFVPVGSNGAVSAKEPLCTLKAKPTVLHEGPERDRLYALLVDYWPDLLQYHTKAFRQFPVIRLDPTE